MLDEMKFGEEFQEPETNPADEKTLLSSVKHMRPLPKEIKKVKTLKIVPFPTSKDQIKQRTLMKKKIIPTHPSSVIINGKSGSGKSMLIVNLLCRPEFYGRDAGRHYFDKIYLFSPTAGKMDDLVKHLLNHTPLKQEDIHNEFDQQLLSKILEEQKQEINRLGIARAPKKLILLDDIQSDQKFLKSKAILKLFTMNRHYNISTYLCSQSFTKTPRACRLQANNIMFFAGSKSETDKVVEEFAPPRITKRDFEDLINHALEEQYAFLHINMRAPWKERFRKNIDVILEL